MVDRRKSAAQQNADVRISDRGNFAYGETGSSDRSVGIVPFGTIQDRDAITPIVPQGTLFFNTDTNNLEISDPNNLVASGNGWIESAVSGSGSSPGPSGSVLAGDLNETLRWNGSEYAPSDALINNDTDIFIKNDLTVSGALIISSGITPSSSSDPSGVNGELRLDDNFLYLKTGGEWRRSSFSRF